MYSPILEKEGARVGTEALNESSEPMPFAERDLRDAALLNEANLVLLRRLVHPLFELVKYVFMLI